MKDRRKEWCKIIKTEKRDYLFQINPDDDSENGFQLKITTQTNTCEVSTSISSAKGIKYEKAKRMLDEANEDTIDELLCMVFQDEEFSLKLDELDQTDEEE